MKLTIKQTNLKLSPQIWDLVYQQFGELDKFIKDINGSVEAWVEIGRTTVHHQKGKIFRAEVDVRLPGQILRAEAERENLELAIIEVREELERQLKSYKERLVAKKRRGQRMVKRIRKESLPSVWFKGKRDKNI